MNRGTATFTFRMPRETLDLIDSVVARHNDRHRRHKIVRADFVRKAIATQLNEIARKLTRGKRAVVPCSQCSRIVPLTPGMDAWINLFGVKEYMCLRCMKERHENTISEHLENAT